MNPLCEDGVCVGGVFFFKLGEEERKVKGV